MRDAWVEFKTVLLPYVIAALYVGLFIYQSERHEAQQSSDAVAFAEAVQGQTEALQTIHTLLSTQGYVTVPMAGSR